MRLMGKAAPSGRHVDMEEQQPTSPILHSIKLKIESDAEVVGKGAVVEVIVNVTAVLEKELVFLQEIYERIGFRVIFYTHLRTGYTRVAHVVAVDRTQVQAHQRPPPVEVPMIIHCKACGAVPLVVIGHVRDIYALSYRPLP